jgi:pSer/pThr/pTyr-binding forkhead associated (FHA) protein
VYAVSVLDSAGGEVGRFDYMDDSTGLISIGGGAQDHIQLGDLPSEQVYLYVTEGQMVIEDPLANGAVLVDGYPLEQPCFVGPENEITVGVYTLQVAAAAQEEMLPPAGYGDPPPPDDARAGDIPAPAVAAGGMTSEPTQHVGPEDSAEAQGHYYQSGAAEVAMDLAYAPGGPAVSRGPLKMEALSGLLAGKEFTLEQNREYDVGRDEILEIPLDDPTVSRRHARLRVSEGGVMVLDLRSSNGTFLNGEQVKRELATAGDRLRFGEVGFKLKRVEPEVGQAEQPEKKKLGPRRLIIISAAGLAVVALLVLGLALQRRFSGGKKGGPPKQQGETLSEKQRRLFREKLERGQRHLSHQRWKKATREFQDALEDYPSMEAKERAEGLLKKAKREQEAKKQIAKAKQAFEATSGDLDGYLSALSLFKKVPLDSYYSIEAKDKVEKISLRLAKLYVDQGMTYYKGRRIKNQLKAHDFLCKYFKVLGNVGRVVVGEDKYRDRLKRLEKKLARKKRRIKRSKQEYKVCKAARFLQKPIEVAGRKKVDVAGALRKKYEKLEDLVGVLMIYYKGDVDEALKQLGKLKSKRKMRKHTVLLSEIHRKLAMIKGKLAEGDSGLQTNDIEGADKSFSLAFKYERQLLPEPLISFGRRDASRRLANRYYKLGEAQFKLGRYKNAFKMWSRGKHFDSSHTKILNGMVRLEKEALRLYQQAQAAGGERARSLYETILEITEEKSPLHAKAEKALKGG